MICPNCKSQDVSRSHRRKGFERLISFFGIYPFRCFDCRNRFYRYSPNPRPERES